jgi:alginate O-acetyltransferase complex protein AlgI
MVFSSIPFLFFFLPVVFAVYALLHRWPVWRNGFLLLASLLFYVWGAGDFVWYLLASILLNWLFGLASERFAGQEHLGRRRAILVFALFVNIGLLSYYKYANFFIDQINQVGELIVQNHKLLIFPKISLPIGISFFTFHSLSYVIDIYRGGVKAVRNPINFALYISCFPQLIAGPIVRYHEIADQLVARSFNWTQIQQGLNRFAVGLVKKVVVADTVSELVSMSFIPGGPLTGADSWLGLIAYTLQIYYDFSGYSDMAIGLALLFGFRFPENFRRPYSAISITDFWRRWHISLSQWFRDYVYIPLGGSRISQSVTYRNLGLVFLLTGIWHGANWTFILWGAFYGALLILEKSSGWDRQAQAVADRGALWPLVRHRSLTLLIVMLAWVVFRADSLGGAIAYYGKLLHVWDWHLSEAMAAMLNWRNGLTLILGSFVFVLPGQQTFGQRVQFKPSLWISYGQLFLVVIFFPYALFTVISGSFSPFLYFQF